MPRMPNQPIRPRCGAEVVEPIRPTAHRDRPDHEQQRGDEAPRGEPPLDRPEQHADRDHRDDLADALDLLVEGEHRVGHERRRVLRIGRHLLGVRGVRVGVRLRPRPRPSGGAAPPLAARRRPARRRRLRRRLLLDPAQGDAGGEHGEKAVAVREARQRRRRGRSGRGRGSCRARPLPCACGAGRARAGRPPCRAPRRCRRRRRPPRARRPRASASRSCRGRAGRAGRGRA